MQKFHIERQMLVADSWGSCKELITVSVNVKDASIKELKLGIELSTYIKETDIFIPKSYSDYDCTGRPFTTDIEILKRFLNKDGSDSLLIYIFIHHYSLDI